MSEKLQKPKKPFSEWTQDDFDQAAAAIKQHAELTGGKDELGNDHYSYGGSLEGQIGFDTFWQTIPHVTDEKKARLLYAKHLDSLHMKGSVEPQNVTGHRANLPATGDGCLPGLFNLITGRNK